MWFLLIEEVLFTKIKMRKIKMKRNITLLLLLLVSGCSAIPINEEAKHVKLVLLAPDSPKCKYLGDVNTSSGSDLSFRTAYSTQETLVETLKNKLRNKTYLMGGNFIYMKKIETPNSLYDVLGMSGKKIAAGKAYRCDKSYDFHNPDTWEVNIKK